MTHYPCGCTAGHTCTTHAIRARAVPSVVRPRVLLPPAPAPALAPAAPSSSPKPRVRGFSFTVPGQPIPKGRPRIAPGHSRPFTPPETVAYEKKVRRSAVAAGVQPLRGMVGIQLRFFRQSRVRVDWDNLAKAITDGINELAYADDAQIHHAAVVKGYDSDNPRCEVRVWELPEEILT